MVDLVEIFLLKDGSPCIALEYLQRGSLRDLVYDTTVMLRPEHIKNLTWQMLNGIAFLHTNFIMHRDLKPENLMIADDGTLKFIDFGMAKKYAEQVKHSPGQITLLYRPPEILFGAQFYGPASDMWSIGCIMAEMVMRRPIFPGSSEID